jgi:hypothetical protein
MFGYKPNQRSGQESRSVSFVVAFEKGLPMGMIDSPEYRHNVGRLHALGPRVLAEFLAELGADSYRMTDIERRLERYARLDPGIVRGLGGNRFPPRPSLRVVGGRRHG